MNRLPNRRFNKGLSSGLSILAIFAVGYAMNETAGSVLAADNPSSNKSSQVESIEIPGTFKELAGKTDSITSKQTASSAISIPANRSHDTLSAIDADKGIAKPHSDINDIQDASGMQDFHATAYSIKGRTASGVYTRPGIIAADPNVLPIGTVVHIRAGRYTGTYTVLDTGSRIKGRTVDIFMPSYSEALQFGRQRIKVKVLGRTSARASRRADPAHKIAEIANL